MTIEPLNVDTVAALFDQSQSSIIVTSPSGEETTDAATLAAVGRELAASFAADGVDAGDRIALQMTNVQLYAEMLACCALGRFVAMSVNTRFSAELSKTLIARSGAVRVVRGRDDLPPAADADAEIGSPGPGDRFVIKTTSGTTSAPKLVVHPQRSIAEHACDVAQIDQLDSDSVVLVSLPLCGTFGLTVFMAALAAHATIVLTDFDATHTASVIERHKVSVSHATDDMFHRMLQTDHDLSSLTWSGYARFNSSLDSVVDHAQARGVPLSGLYGMSEVQALFVMRDPALPQQQRWLPGGALISDRALCRVVDGELQVRGPSLFEGYLADGGAELDAKLTAEHFDDGWFRTGDLAQAETPRSFRYVSRMGDTLRLGGFLVAPAEIETTLVELPEIAEAQVVAVDLERGARPVAFVITAAGMAIDEQAAIRHCQARLAKFKSPVRVVSVDSFPVTDGPNGVKVQRTKLRDRAAALLAE